MANADIHSVKMSPRTIDRKKFAANLEFLLKKHGFTPAELARRSTLGPDRISIYRSGRSVPNEASIEKLMIAFECGVNELVGETKPTEPTIRYENSSYGSKYLDIEISGSFPVKVAIKILEVVRETE